jgi:hypothetical protein
MFAGAGWYLRLLEVLNAGKYTEVVGSYMSSTKKHEQARGSSGKSSKLPVDACSFFQTDHPRDQKKRLLSTKKHEKPGKCKEVRCKPHGQVRVGT